MNCDKIRSKTIRDNCGKDKSLWSFFFLLLWFSILTYTWPYLTRIFREFWVSTNWKIERKKRIFYDKIDEIVMKQHKMNDKKRTMETLDGQRWKEPAERREKFVELRLAKVWNFTIFSHGFLRNHWMTHIYAILPIPICTKLATYEIKYLENEMNAGVKCLLQLMK